MVVWNGEKEYLVGNVLRLVVDRHHKCCNGEERPLGAAVSGRIRGPAPWPPC